MINDLTKHFRIGIQLVSFHRDTTNIRPDLPAPCHLHLRSPANKGLSKMLDSSIISSLGTKVCVWGGENRILKWQPPLCKCCEVPFPFGHKWSKSFFSFSPLVHIWYHYDRNIFLLVLHDVWRLKLTIHWQVYLVAGTLLLIIQHSSQPEGRGRVMRQT